MSNPSSLAINPPIPDPRPSMVWPIVSVVVGGVFAVVGTFGIVSVVGALPPAVDAPYVVYGNS